jgi:hypothetical protein
MNRQYESMTRAVIAGFTVRVWCEEKEVRAGPDLEVLRRLKGIDVEAEQIPGVISKTLDGLPNVSAYEILDEQGHGAIVYPDWR